MVVVLAEAVFFRQIAGLVSWVFGQGWGPGSSIQYFRNVYFLPAAASLFLAAAVAWLSSARRAALLEKQLLAIAWAVDAALLVGFLGWYFSVVFAAGRVVGPRS